MVVLDRVENAKNLLILLSWRDDRNGYADMAQSVERVLGKDEVTSSNLVISSKKAIQLLVVSLFFVMFVTFVLTKSAKFCRYGSVGATR